MSIVFHNGSIINEATGEIITSPLAPLHIGDTISASVGGQTLTSLSGLFTGSIVATKLYDADNSQYFVDPFFIICWCCKPRN